jgi:hypothetical protein
MASPPFQEMCRPPLRADSIDPLLYNTHATSGEHIFCILIELLEKLYQRTNLAINSDTIDPIYSKLHSTPSLMDGLCYDPDVLFSMYTTYAA